MLKEFLSLYSHKNFSRKKMERYAHKKLVRLLLVAAKKSAYYKNLFENIGLSKAKIKSLSTKELLSRIPPISKKTFLDCYDSIVTDSRLSKDALASGSVERFGYTQVHSSGSTGTPAFFAYSRSAWKTLTAGLLRGAFWGLNLLQIFRLAHGARVAYIAAVDGPYGGAIGVASGMKALGVKFLAIDVNEPIEKIRTSLEDFSPNVLIGYPSALKIIAGLADENSSGKKLELNLRRVASCGEPFSSSFRTVLEKSLGVEILNYYGSSESLALGADLDGSGIELFDDLNIIERTEDGIFLTCLYNLEQPLIRYKISDTHELVSEDGAFTKIRPVNCRSEDLLWFCDKKGNRDFLHPLSVEGFCIQGLLDYQFSKCSDSHFCITCETKTNANKEKISSQLKEELSKILERKNLSWVEFCIEFTDRIKPDSRTGKKRLVVTEAA